VITAYTTAIWNLHRTSRWVDSWSPQGDIYRPCTKLHKSLYGHPEGGGHWGRKFKSVMSELNAVESPLCPSNFTIKELGLLVTLYVDDIVVSEPSANHQKFWDMLSNHLLFEEPKMSTKESFSMTCMSLE